MIKLKQDSRVVVRLPNALGDTVMATATLRRIASVVSPENITLVGPPAAIATLSACSFFGSSIVYDRKGRDRGLKGLWRKSREIGALGADLAVILPNSLSTAMMFFLARVPQRIGYFKEGRRILLTAGKERVLHDALPLVPKYTGAYFHDLLSGLTNLPEQNLHPSLEVSQAGIDESAEWARQSGRDRSKPLLVLVPGAAYGPAKMWIPERFAEVADALVQERGAQVFISCGPGEEEIGNRVRKAMKEEALPEAKLSIQGLLGVYQGASFCLTNDTGPRHIAVAFNVPTLTLMGPMSEILTDLPSEQGEMIREPVDCAPCFQKVCPLPEKICMTKLSSDKVLQKALELFPKS